MYTCYDTIWRFTSSEKGRWLLGLLKEAGHQNFVLSGPWTPSGEVLGRFGSSLDALHLLLDREANTLVVRMDTKEQRVSCREWLERNVPQPVALRFAEDLSSERLWTTVRSALRLPADYTERPLKAAFSH
jgi:hypothetical protein